MPHSATELLDARFLAPPFAPSGAAEAQADASASEAYIGYDRQWRVVELSEGGRAWTARMGTDPDALLGQVLWDAYPALRGSEFERWMRRAMDERVPVRFVLRSAASSRWFETVAYPSDDGLGAFMRDVTAGRLAERMHRLLAEAGRVLGDASLDVDATLSALTGLAIPELADWCFVDEAAPDGGFTRMAVAHADPALGALAARLRRRHGPAQGSAARDHGIDWNRPMLISPVSAQIIDAVARDDEHRAMLQELRLRSVIVVPLAARGALIGTLLLGRTSTPEPYGADDLALAEELARRASTALDTARLYQAAEVAVRRTARLQQVTASLGRATRVDEVARVIVEQGVRAMDAASGTVLLLDAGAAVLELVYAVGYPDAALAHIRRVALDGGFPAAEACRTGAPVFASTSAERLARYPALAPLAAAMATNALAVLPLVLDDARLGAVVFNFTAAREFDGDDRRFLDALAQQCAQAVERARLYDAEREARAEAEQANRAKSAFLATISHELRTPLNAIGGYAELLEMGIYGDLPAEQLDVIRRVQRSHRHLLSLINDVLQFARLEAGHVDLAIGNVECLALIEGLEPLVAPQLGAAGIVYSLAPPDPELRLRGDEEKVRQILLNLVSNAIKFTPRGGRIAVSAAPDGDAVRLHVLDTGVGIAREHLDRVFDAFVQLGRTLSTPAAGVGLGLAISRDLARAMGGDLSVESTPGAGSTFTLVLPRA